jgi:hypothetical protein
MSAKFSITRIWYDARARRPCCLRFLAMIEIMNFFCVGVMYSGEYDACDVTLSVYHDY